VPPALEPEELDELDELDVAPPALGDLPPPLSMGSLVRALPPQPMNSTKPQMPIARPGPLNATICRSR